MRGFHFLIMKFAFAYNANSFERSGTDTVSIALPKSQSIIFSKRLDRIIGF